MNKSKKTSKKRLHKGKKIEAKKPLLTVELKGTFISSSSMSGHSDPPPSE